MTKKSQRKELKELEEKLSDAKTESHKSYRLMMNLKQDHFKSLLEKFPTFEKEVQDLYKKDKEKIEVLEKEFEVVEEQENKRIKEARSRKRALKAQKLNPKLNYKHGRHWIRFLGCVPSKDELLVIKGNKILVWNYGNSWSDNGGTNYSNSCLELKCAKELKFEPMEHSWIYPEGEEKNVYTSRYVVGEDLFSGGRLGKKHFKEHIEKIREFFGEPNLQPEDIVRGFLLILEDK